MSTICAIGHITKDRIVTPKSEVFTPGGTAYYFSKALGSYFSDFELVTAVGKPEERVLDELREMGLRVTNIPSENSVFFENIYEANFADRIQNVITKAASFDVGNLPEREAQIFHLCPLLLEDISLQVIQLLGQRGKVSIDIQGLLRYTKGLKVHYTDWADKLKGLPSIYFLKASEEEAQILTGLSDMNEAAIQLAGWGVQEVIITLGSRGSIILKEGKFTRVPAYEPNEIVDTTGCGDTYMAGYLFQRLRNESTEKAGRFGAAMATLKIDHFGPFNGTVEEIERAIATRKQLF